MSMPTPTLESVAGSYSQASSQASPVVGVKPHAQAQMPRCWAPTTLGFVLKYIYYTSMN